MKNILDYKIIEIGTYTLSVYHLAAILLIFLSVWIILKLLKSFVIHNMRLRKARQYAIYQIVKYLLIITASIITLNLLGVKVGVLLAGSAALLVGIGLGLQNLFNDFVSGVIILLDYSVKVNDIIDINGLVCKVQKINIRTTTVLTRDDKYIILPNSALTSNQLINWTHTHETSRFEVQVGIDYSADVHRAMKIIQDIAEEHLMVVSDPKPIVRLIDFGNSSIDLQVLFWTNEVFRVENIKSDIRIKIYDSFKKNGITIPFPQRVVHMKSDSRS
jgi:small-conductance mechanosensitive channel